MLNRRAFTLIELLIAITLVGMILLTISAVDIASRKFLNTADYESRVQNEVSPILEMIAKDITLGYGNDNNPGLYVPASTEVEIRRLDAASPPRYDIFTDDPWVRYRYDSSTHSIIKDSCTGSLSRCGTWGGPETLANNISGCSFIIGIDPTLNKNLYVTIAITALRDASISADINKNPQVILQTRVAARSQSIH